MGLALSFGVPPPPLGAEASGRVGVAVCQGWTWQAGEETRSLLSVPFPNASRLCLPEWPVSLSAVSKVTAQDLAVNYFIEITSTMVYVLASGSGRGDFTVSEG